MAIMELDLKDRKLLFALEQDARQTNVALSKVVGLAPDVIQYRIDRLIDRGILKFFVGYVNSARLGYMDYGLNFCTQRMTRAKEQAFVKFFINHPYCLYFGRSGGTYDYVADILSRDPSSMMDLLTEITNTFSDFIYRQDVITRISITHYPKQYLLDACKPPNPPTYFGGRIDQRVQIDETDDIILRILSKNARAKLIDIAKRVKLSDTAVRNRIRRMEQEELITGYFAWIEPQLIGYQSINLLLKHQNFRSSDEERLFEYCRTHRHITWLIKTLGIWDFEINVEVKTQEDLQEVVYDLKDNFPGMIQRVEYAPVFSTLKYSFYPFSLAVQAWL